MTKDIRGWITWFKPTLLAALGLVVLLTAAALFAVQAEARGHGSWDRGPMCDEPTALVCEEGQHVESVMVDPGQEAVEEVSHVVHHEEVTEEQQVCEPVHDGPYNSHTCDQPAKKNWHGQRFDLVTRTVVVQEAYDEVVIDVEGQEAIPPTYEDQCIDDEEQEPVDYCPLIEGVQAEDDPCFCEEGYEAVDNQCVPIDPGPTVCEEGYELVDEQCVPISDPAPTVYEAPRGGGSCMNCGDSEETEEPAEETLDGGALAEQEEEEEGELEEVGEVAGAFCVPLLTTYMRENQENDFTEVVKLQAFLKRNLGKEVAVTGTFDHATHQYVEEFQKKHWQDVLLPWVPLGLPTAQTPTGYVYKTTLWKINKIECPSLDIPQPVLE